MQGIWQPTPFSGFGCSQWTAARPILATEIVLPDEDRQARRLVRARCGATPGVYGMINAEGELIYIGKSRSLRDRLVSYFYDTASNEKGRRIIGQTARLTWEPATHEFTALLRELELIRRWRPRFNVQGQPGRLRRTYVCVSQGAAPHVYLASRPTARTQECFGPIRGNWRVRDAVAHLNHYFKLRDCPQDTPLHFSDQRELFPQVRTPRCLRGELGSCLAPCVAGCSTEQYDAQVSRALAFLRGTDLGLLASLEKAMQQAAAEQQFERAALLRNAWTELSWLNEQLDRLRQVRDRYSFVYPLPGYNRQRHWFLIRHGQLAGVMAAPSRRRNASRSLARLEEVYQARGLTIEASHEDLDLLWLITRWFRKFPDELEKTLPPEQALQHCWRLVRRPK